MSSRELAPTGATKETNGGVNTELIETDAEVPKEQTQTEKPPKNEPEVAGPTLKEMKDELSELGKGSIMHIPSAARVKELEKRIKEIENPPREENELLVRNSSFFASEKYNEGYKEKVLEQQKKDSVDIEYRRNNINNFNRNLSEELDKGKLVQPKVVVADGKKSTTPDNKEPGKTAETGKPKGSDGKPESRPGREKGPEVEREIPLKAKNPENPIEKDLGTGVRYASESQRVAESKTVKIEAQYKRLDTEGEDENDAKEKISQLERERIMAAGSAEMTRAIKRQRQNIQEDGSIEKEAGIGQMTLTAARILEIGFNAEIDRELLQSRGMAARNLAEREGSNYYSAFNKNYYKKAETAKEGEKKVPEKDKPFEHELFVRDVNILQNAKNRGKDGDYNRALRIMLRKTGREAYFDEIISDKNAKFPTPTGNNEKFVLGVSWTDKNGDEKTLNFETNFAVKGNKKYKPGNLFMRNLGFWKKHPVEITTKEEIKKKTSPVQQKSQGKEQVVPPVGVEAIQKQMRDNYPETFKNLGLLKEENFDTKEEFENIAKAIASLEKGDKKPARDVITQMIQEAKDTKLAMEAENKDTAWMDKTIKNLNSLLLELNGTGNKTNKTEGGEDEKRQWEVTKARLLKAYPALEKIAATRGDNEKAQRYNFVVNAYLESIDDKQLTDLAKQLEKGGSVFEIPFDEGKLIGDRQEVENKYIKKITEGKWDESDTKDLNDIKKLVRGTIPFRIIGSVVKDYKDKKNNDQAQSSEGENEKQQDSDATKKDGNKTEGDAETKPKELKSEDIKEGDIYKIYTDTAEWEVSRENNKLLMSPQVKGVSGGHLVDERFSVEVGKEAKISTFYKGRDDEGRHLALTNIKKIEKVR